MPRRPVVLTAVVWILAASFGLSAQSSAPLVQPGQLVWDGAFRLPHDNGDGFSSFAYGTYALGFDAATGHLYVACHAEGRQIGQVTIPTPSKATTLSSLPIATRTQPCVDITEGRYSQIGGYPKWYPGGLIVHGGRLIESMWSYFDSMDATAAKASHFTHSRTLDAAGTVTGPHRLAGYTTPGMPGFVAGYMALVPPEWQASLGGPALTGQCCIPISVRSSWGPNAISFDPAQLGTVDPVPASTLLNYPQWDTKPNSNWTGQSDFFNLSTFMGGMFIPSGTRSLLYVGRQGTGPGSYRSGIDPYCGDGLNAPPYQLQVWAYDLNDLAAVKAGQKRPNDLRPYAYGSQWVLTSNQNPVLPYVNSCMYIRGLAHDPATNRIWIATGFPKAGQLIDGDYPVIQQFHVSTTVVTPPPSQTISLSPTSLTPPAAGGSFPITVTASDPAATWTAASDQPWATVAPTGGTGSGSVTVTVTANTAAARAATLTIAGQPVAISQAAAATTPPPTSAYTVDWSTYAMPSPTDEGAQGTWTDSQGNVYIAGGYQGTGFTSTLKACGDTDTMIAKYSPAGALVWSRCDGGPGRDYIHTVLVDAAGNVFASGVAYAAGFPVTTGAYQTTWKGGPKDDFVMKLSPSGALVWATYLGGTGDEHDRSVLALDAAGNVVIAGSTTSTDFPTTAGAYQRTNAGGNDGFVAKLSPDGRTLVASTYVGGSGADTLLSGVAVMADGSVAAAGWTLSTNIPTTAGAVQRTNAGGEDVLYVRLDASLASLVYATYLGGSGQDRASENHGALWAADGRAILAGYTSSPNLPTTAGAYQPANRGGFDEFVAVLNPAGSAVTALTYLGSPGDELNAGVALDGSGQIALAGETSTGGFPLAGPVKSTPQAKDAVVSVLSADLKTLVFSTYAGGTGDDRGRGVAAAGSRIVLGGDTYSTNYPVTNGTTNHGARDFFLTAFSPGTVVPPPLCTPALSTILVTIAAAGGSVPVGVTSTCPWTAVGSTWAAVSPASGIGNGTVTITVPAYTAPTDRMSLVTIAGLTVTVKQTAAQCSFTLAPTSIQIPLTGGSVPVQLTTSDPACPWQLNNQLPWLQVTPINGVGSATVTFTAPDATHAGTVNINGVAITVSQP